MKKVQDAHNDSMLTKRQFNFRFCRAFRHQFSRSTEWVYLVFPPIAMLPQLLEGDYSFQAISLGSLSLHKGRDRRGILG